jgi:triphosphoribosyl-dephospho-CoA synthase
MTHLNQSTAAYVGNCASIAALLEVSAYPKPGNIHRLSDLQDTKYEHFLAGGVSLGSVMGGLAEKSSNTDDFGSIRIGESIREAVDEMFKWQNGGNIHLGVILLFAPLSAAAGAIISHDIDADELRGYTRRVISEATSQDTVDIYAAIDRAMSLENLGSADELDVTDQRSIDRIMRENITLLQVFEICREKDMICREWVTGFSMVFETGYPYLIERIQAGASINDATVDTFLKILADNPDSLILRKSGLEAAKTVSKKAEAIMQAGGTATETGRKMLNALDDELKEENGKMNPGTTADLTAASLFVLLLTGWRP